MKFKFLTLISVVLFAVGCASSQKSSLPPHILLGAEPNFSSIEAFQNLTHLTPGTPAFEKNRIDYLMQRLRDSRHEFVRNGKSYSGSRALLHLKWKYFRYRDEVSSAEAFIDRIGSGSRKTGKDYHIRIGKKDLYKCRLALENELQILDQALRDYHQTTIVQRVGLEGRSVG